MKKFSRRHFFIFILFLSSISSLWGQESDAYFDFQETVFPAWKSSQWHERLIGGIQVSAGLATMGLGIITLPYGFQAVSSMPVLGLPMVTFSLGVMGAGGILVASGWGDLFQPWDLPHVLEQDFSEGFRARFHQELGTFTLRRVLSGLALIGAGAFLVNIQQTIAADPFPPGEYSANTQGPPPAHLLAGWAFIGIGTLQAVFPTSRELAWWAHLGRFPL